MRSLRGKRVVVMGLGLLGGGQTVATWLLDEGAKVTITDLKSANVLRKSIDALSDTRITWHLGGHVEEDFTESDLIIQNPGVPADSPYLALAKKHSIPILNEAALFFLIAKRPIIAVTGTRGKSTTSTLISLLLQEKYPKTFIAGNRGDVPMFSFIREAGTKSKDPIVLELSSWQVEGLAAIKQSPHVAVLTNLYPDHLNRYDSLDAYYNAKATLFAFQGKNDVAVINAGNAASQKFAKKCKSQVYWFSTGEELPAGAKGVHVRNDTLLFRSDRDDEKRLIQTKDMRISGMHNIENLAAALVVARLYDIAPDAMHRVIKRFTGIWGRQQKLGNVQGRMVINDTTASTPEGLLAFLKVYPESVLITGGNNKNLSYAHVPKAMRAAKVKHCIILPGTASELLIKELRKQGSTIPLTTVTNLKEAVSKAFSVSKHGDIVALVPGATSFAEFNNEFERGDMFEKLVRTYA